MTIVAFEQRNPYKGSPPRPWLRLRLQRSMAPWLNWSCSLIQATLAP